MISGVEESFDFLTEVIEEGKVSAIVPKLPYAKEHAPSKAPVFFNPLMELNRDLTVLALNAYQKIVGKKVSICEPLTGCGIRGIRFAIEVDGVRRVVLGDVNPMAARLAQHNVKRSGLTDRVFVFNEDSNLLLSRHAAPYKRFDFIDVDPFGSPAPYIDSAVRALRDGGLLALTATDMAPLCGVHPRACIRKYGGRPMRTEYCHELAVRLLIGCLVMMAAKHRVGVKVVLSHSTNHYIRAYALANYSATQADKSIREMGCVLHCFSCLHRELVKGIIPNLARECPNCGASLNVAGPLWIGKLFDEKILLSMSEDVARRDLKQKKVVAKLISILLNEVEGPPTYYVTDKICDKMNIPTPPLIEVLDRLRGRGFKAIPTHFNSKGIKTDASVKIVKEIIFSIVN